MENDQKIALPLPIGMPNCEGCKAGGARLCQGDVVLCTECSAARGSQPQRSRGAVEGAVSAVIVDDLLC